MILRRVIEHMKHQHWTAIWIDLVIVILGVFIGTQVSNWNTERETRQKSALFTERLNADLKVEAWGYEYLVEYNKDVLANAGKVLAALAGEKPLADEEFVVAAYRASQYEFQDRRRATYDELVSTGSIGLIVDQKLRETAIVVFSAPIFDQVQDGGRRSEYREIFRRTVSAPVQQALLQSCGDRIVPPLDYKGIVHSLDYQCKLDAPADKIAAAAQALRSRAGLESALQLRFADIETDLANLQTYNPQLMQLREYAGRGK